MTTGVDKVDLYQNNSVYDVIDAVSIRCTYSYFDDPLPGKTKFCYCFKDEEVVLFNNSDVVEGIMEKAETTYLIQSILDPGSTEYGLSIANSLIDMIDSSCLNK